MSSGRGDMFDDCLDAAFMYETVFTRSNECVCVLIYMFDMVYCSDDERGA